VEDLLTVARSDADEYRFFTHSGAEIICRLAGESREMELQVFGNRSGLLSLADVLLWFIANSWRRELLSLEELEFVKLEGSLSLCLRLTVEAAAGIHGTIRRQDRRESLEWTCSEDELQRVAILIHRLVAMPCHEYDRLMLADGSEFGMEVRMTDASAWF
jgi:hypothetical protein